MRALLRRSVWRMQKSEDAVVTVEETEDGQDELQAEPEMYGKQG